MNLDHQGKSRRRLFAAVARQHSVSVKWLRLIDGAGSLNDPIYLGALVEAEDRGLWQLVNPDVRTQLVRYLPEGRSVAVNLEYLARQCGLTRGDLLRGMVDSAEICGAPANANYQRRHGVLAHVTLCLELTRERQEADEREQLQTDLSHERAGRQHAERELSDAPKKASKAKTVKADAIAAVFYEAAKHGKPGQSAASIWARMLEDLKRQHASDKEWRRLLDLRSPESRQRTLKRIKDRVRRHSDRLAAEK